MKYGFSIELLFNKEFNDCIRYIWKQCADSNYSDYFLKIKGDIVPHIALSVYEDINKSEIMELFDRYKSIDENRSSFQTSSVCLFKATNVTYLNVNVNRNMLNYFENVYYFFSEISDKCSKYYLPSVIVPHITIGRNKNLDDAKKCWNFVTDIFTPQELLIEKIGLYELKGGKDSFDEAIKLDEKILK